jgi:hypothetical protein
MKFIMQSPIISSPLGPNILLSALFSNTLNLCSSLNLSSHVSVKLILLKLDLKPRISEYEECCYLLGCNALKSGRSLPIIMRNTLPPSSGWKSRSNKFCFQLAFCWLFPFRPLIWKQWIPPKCLRSSVRLHSVISQKVVLFVF